MIHIIKLIIGPGNEEHRMNCVIISVDLLNGMFKLDTEFLLNAH